jgi:hypothetical protein
MPVTIDEFIDNLDDWRPEVIRAIQGLIHEARPDLQASLRSGQIVYGAPVPLLWIRARRDAVELGFTHGARLPDPEAALEGEGEHRHLSFSGVEDIDGAVLRPLLSLASAG